MKKFLVIVHIYYIDQVEELSNLIKALNFKDDEYDLFVSISEDKLADLDINKYFLGAKVILSKNVGYDIWPFLNVIQHVELNNYKYLIKLHTKRNLGYKIVYIAKKYFFWGWQWRRALLSFIRRNHFVKTIEAFEKKPDLGMVNSYMLIDECYASEDLFHYKFCFDEVNRILKKLDFKFQNPIRYIAGTMFICRANLLSPLKKLSYSDADFCNVDRNNENDLPHILERLFGAVVTAQGYTIDDPFTSLPSKVLNSAIGFLIWLNMHRLVRKTSRFLFRVDFDKTNNKKIIKIFKIKVFTVDCK